MEQVPIKGYKYEFIAKQAILRIADTPEEAREMVQYLMTLDWQQEFLDRKANEDARIQSYMEELARTIEQGGGYCDRCDELVQKLYAWPHSPRLGELIEERHWHFCWRCWWRKQARAYGILWGEHLFRCDGCERLIREKSAYRILGKGYCLFCVEQAAERQFIACKVCGKKTTNFASLDMCRDCDVKYPYQSNISTHLTRAREAGAPSTLTLTQWVQNVVFFGNHCAYCRAWPFQVIEHFLPIILGGGTTAENCVPACKECNSRKNATHPDNLGLLFPPEAIEHIKHYLLGEKQKIHSFIAPNRALVLWNTHL